MSNRYTITRITLMIALVAASLRAAAEDLPTSPPIPTVPVAPPVPVASTQVEEANFLDKHIQTLRQLVALQKAEYDSHQAQKVKLTQELEAKQRELAVAQGDTAALQADIAKLTTQVASTNKSLTDTQAALEATNTELDAKRAEMRTLDAAVKRARDYLAALAKKDKDALGEMVEVKVDGKSAQPLGRGSPAVLTDSEGQCQIEVAVHSSAKTRGINTLAALKIKDVYLTTAQQARLPLGYTTPDLRTAQILMDRPRVCSPLRAAVRNRLPIELHVEWESDNGTSLNGDFRMQYERARWEGLLGIGTYFGGGAKSFENLSQGTQFAVLPALRGGIRLNAPVDPDPDLYIGLVALLGGGFVAPVSGPAPITNGEDKKILSVFAGGAFEFGRYLELGYAYDVLNGAHMIVFSPAKALSTEILF